MLNSIEDKDSIFSIPVAYMEDEKIVRKETQLALKSHWNNVELIANNKDALGFAERHIGQQFVMYILDINMGIGNTKLGIVISRKLKNLYPNSLVVLLSSKLGEVSFDEICTSKADVVVKKDSIRHDVDGIIQQTRAILKSKQNKDKSLSDNLIYLSDRTDGKVRINVDFSMSKIFDDFLFQVKKAHQEYFKIACTTESPQDEFFSEITDKFVSRKYVLENLATKIVQLHICSNQPHNFDVLERLLHDFSSIEMPVPTLEPLHEYEKNSVTLMVLYPKTGSLNSFGDKINFLDDGIMVTPGLLDLLDISCETSVVENNALIDIDIKCVIFGIYS